MVNILSIAASFRTESSNKKLLGIAATLATQTGATITPIDYRDCECPLLRDDQDPSNLPQGAKHLASALHAADGFLLATPEYNWSMPGALKNLIDWLSVDASLPLKGKTALLLSASPSIRGGVVGLTQLRVPLEVLGVWVHPQLVGIGRAHEMLGDNALNDAKEQRFLEECVADFVKKTKAIVT